MSNFNPSYAQFLSSQTQAPKKGLENGQFIARVTHVVQGPYLIGTDIRDQYYENPTDLGVITFQLLNGPQDRTLDSWSIVTGKLEIGRAHV